jgi:hypothetical protein
MNTNIGSAIVPHIVIKHQTARLGRERYVLHRHGAYTLTLMAMAILLKQIPMMATPA